MKVPAGLIDKNVETFAVGDKLFTQCDGIVAEFQNSPKEIYDEYIKDMLSHPEKVMCLHALGITSIDEMVYKYSWCNYGGYDPRADFDTTTKRFTSEYWDCGKRGQCPYEFTLCDKVKFDVNGSEVFLTKKEVEIVKLIAQGLTDIQAADKAKITVNTMFVHKKNIYAKLNINSQAQLTKLACDNNLV